LASTAKKALHLAKHASRRAIVRPWRAHGLVLLYHRVAAASWDPFKICVDPEHFEQHLAAICGVADVVPLNALASGLRRGRRPRPVVALTFDDGYADNLHAALPVLERYDAPATVFVTSALIGRCEPFWWDRLSTTLSAIREVPREVRLQVGQTEFIWQRGADVGDAARDRHRLLLAVWSALLEVSDEVRRGALDDLERLADAGRRTDPDARPMTPDELRRLASSPLIEIGAHTTSHPWLAGMPRDVQLEQIADSRQQCRDLTGESPSSFAYPFGAFDAVTLELVRSAGFERACSTEKDLVWTSSDMMLLPRVSVPNHAGRMFSARLRLESLL
jgi:peptidoglycan/xylan/chitin deacetylase (PgdA/CDA1 family)